MEQLLDQIRSCTICSDALTLGPRPVLSAHEEARIAIIGQAPGIRVHESGIPWNDPSGKQLRKWMGVTDTVFYDSGKIAIVPMGFCYPGKGRSGDLPPREECAPNWHESLFAQMPKIQLTLLIGQYAQRYYLKDAMKRNLTETVKHFEAYLPHTIVLPHPSPRNRFWLAKNPWFSESVIPELKKKVAEVLS